MGGTTVSVTVLMQFAPRQAEQTRRAARAFRRLWIRYPRHLEPRVSDTTGRATCAHCKRTFKVGPIGRVPTFCKPSCRVLAFKKRHDTKVSPEDQPSKDRGFYMN